MCTNDKFDQGDGAPKVENAIPFQITALLFLTMGFQSIAIAVSQKSSPLSSFLLPH